jgi:hypothetical protein
MNRRFLFFPRRSPKKAAMNRRTPKRLWGALRQRKESGDESPHSKRSGAIGLIGSVSI